MKFFTMEFKVIIQDMLDEELLSKGRCIINKRIESQDKDAKENLGSGNSDKDLMHISLDRKINL